MSDQDALKENLLGKAAYEKRDFSAAISHYEKAILLDSSQMVFHDNLAEVYLETDFLEKCVRSCETAMEVGRGADSKLVAKVLRRLASAHRKMGNLTVAEALKEKAAAAEEGVPHHFSTGFFQSVDETESSRAELRRKEKELINIKRKIIDVQIAEAREQMKAGPRSANPIRASTSEENSKGDEKEEGMSTKKIKQSFAEKLSENYKMFIPKSGEDSDRSEDGKEEETDISEDGKEEDTDSSEESVDYENVITFKVFKYGPDDPSPFVSLSDAERDVRVMYKADEIVVPEDRKSISVVFEAYLKDKFVFELKSPSGKGFTRGELVKAIAKKYKEIYQEEEETSTLPVETMKERSARLGGGAGCNLINRAQTEGKYGIWGHDLSDLTLDEVIFNPEQNRYHLEISS